MEVKFTKIGEVAVIEVEGRLDTLSAPDFEKQIQGWISQGEANLVVDFNRLDYISSAGLRSLMVAAKAAKAKGGRLSCSALKGVVKKVFEVSGFSNLLPVYDSVEAAIHNE